LSDTFAIDPFIHPCLDGCDKTSQADDSDHSTAEHGPIPCKLPNVDSVSLYSRWIFDDRARMNIPICSLW